MKATVLTTLAMAMAAMATAVPQDQTDSTPLAAQDVAAAADEANTGADPVKKAIVCTGPNLTRDCRILTRPPGECGEFNPPFDNAITSLQPYKGFQCTFWTAHGCSRTQNDALRDVSFKIGDLRTYAGGVFNNRFSSWKCGPVN